MRKVSISQAWDETRAIIARDGRLLMSVALALVVLPQTFLSVAGVSGQSQTSVLIGVLLFAAFLLGFAAQIALNRLAMHPTITVGGAITRGFVRVLPMFGSLVLIGLGVIVALVLFYFALAMAGVVAMPTEGQAAPVALIALLLLVVVLLSPVFQLLVPVAAAEPGGPIRLLSRSWALGRANYLRLLGFVFMIFVAAALLVLAARVVIGSAVVLTLGAPNPWTLSALIMGLFIALIQAALTIVASVMLARIYLQAAGGEEGAR
jgi:hypothetical protein